MQCATPPKITLSHWLFFFWVTFHSWSYVWCLNCLMWKLRPNSQNGSGVHSNSTLIVAYLQRSALSVAFCRQPWTCGLTRESSQIVGNQITIVPSFKTHLQLVKGIYLQIFQMTGGLPQFFFCKIPGGSGLKIGAYKKIVAGESC